MSVCGNICKPVCERVTKKVCGDEATEREFSATGGKWEDRPGATFDDRTGAEFEDRE